MPFHVKEKSAWKTLQLPEDVLNTEDFSGLVDIQELTDYELISFETNEGSESEIESQKTPRSRKRKRGVEQDKGQESEESILKEKRLKTNSSDAWNITDLKSEHEKPNKVQNKKKKIKKKQLSKAEENGCSSAYENKFSVNENPKHKIIRNANINHVTSSDDEDSNITSNITHEQPADLQEKKKGKGKVQMDNLNQKNKSEISSDLNKKNSKIEKKSKKNRKKKKEPSKSAELVSQIEEDDSKKTVCDQEASTIDMSEWKDLFVPDEILKALQDQKFASPTVIQRLALPCAIRDRKDILGAAETGSGKTLAFGIPLLSRILDLKRLSGFAENEDKSLESDASPESDGEGDSKTNFKKPPIALILEPTRELAVQVRKHLAAVSKYTNIKFANIVGGMSIEKQRRVLSKSPEVVIATPGRIWQLIEEGNEHLCQVDRILCLVVDEADRMVEKGHYEELTKLLELVNKSNRRQENRQTFIMSATLTMDIAAPKRLKNKGKKPPKEEDKIKSLIERISVKGKPKVIDLTPKDKVAQTLTEMRVNCKADEKDWYLYYIVTQHPGRTLVFVNSKDCLRRLITVFSLLQCSPLPLHADMHQRQRLKNLDRFSENKRGLLVASDVAARGLDIPGVDHVIHYQVPRTMENYVHRSGRTARASNLGLSVMLVGPEDAKDYRKIMFGVRNGEDLPLLPVETDLMPAVRQRVSLAREVDVKEYRLKKKRVKNNFFIKAAEEMDMILDDERLLEDMGDSSEQADARQELAGLKASLARSLKGGLAPLRMSKYPTKSGGLVSRTKVDLFSHR